MRRVAQELETGPASLYVYIRNTTELHALVIDELLGTVKIPNRGTWQRRLTRLVTDYRDVLSSHQGLARSALAIRPSGPNLLRLFDRMMTLLISGGVTPARAAWGVDLLLLHATATAAEHATAEPGDSDADRVPGDAQAAMSRAVLTADIDSTPVLAANAETVVGGSPTQRWQWMLHIIIAGIIASDEPTISQ